ncbi:somatostatin receptor type 2-like isoform X2 [Styela clava]
MFVMEELLDANTTSSPDTEVTIEHEAVQLDGIQKFVIFFKVLIYVIGVVGNLLVIFVILYFRQYKKATHWYVLQLALADLLFLQIIPFKITETVYNAWIYPEWLCKMMQTIMFLNYYASILFLMIMAIDRYLALCHPMTVGITRFRSRNTWYIVIAMAAWIISLLICIPVMLYSANFGLQPHCRCTFEFPKDPLIWCRKNQFAENDTDNCVNEVFPKYHQTSCSVPVTARTDMVPENETDYDIFSGSGNYIQDLFGLDYILSEEEQNNASRTEHSTPSASNTIEAECVYGGERPGWSIFIYFNFSVMFLLPLVIITFCYALIILRVIHRTVGDRRNSATSNQSQMKDKMRVTIVCALLVLLFIVCWLPFHSVHIAKIAGIRTGGNLCQSLSTAISILAFINSALNPYFYNFVGRDFRQRIKQVSHNKRFRSFLRSSGLMRLGSVFPRRASSHPQEQSNISSSNDDIYANKYTGNVTPLQYRSEYT